jgi:phosphoglycerate dehydrogenase-like enzyme
MIDEQAVSLMPRGSFLVNTSRGPIVDVHAVVAALRSDHLGGAALDVLPSEPPTDLEAFAAPNLIMTPHSAFYSEEAIQESQTKAATAIAMALRGQEPHYRVA